MTLSNGDEVSIGLYCPGLLNPAKFICKNSNTYRKVRRFAQRLVHDHQRGSDYMLIVATSVLPSVRLLHRSKKIALVA